MSESASGKANSSTDAADKEFSCDRCGSVHDSQRALSIHETRAHNGPVGGGGIDCPNEECDQSFHCQRGVIDHLTSGCGEAGHTCGECDRTFPTKRGWRVHKKQEHGIDTRPTVECATCGEKRRVNPNYLEKRERSFCSDECFGKWRREHKSGKDNPAWRGGGPLYYGPNWDQQRREAIERDEYRCQSCGRRESDLDHTLHVHHITPLRDFDSYEEANKLNNLVTYCISCHNRWEGLPIKPEVI